MYQMLLKEIKEDINRWKDILCSWIGRHSIIKMSVVPKVLYNAIPIKITTMFFCRNGKKSISKFIWNLKGTQIAKTIKKEQSWKSHTSWFQNVLHSYNNKNSVIWYKDGHTDQWNRIKSSEIMPHIYGQMTFDKDSKTIQWGKDNLFNKWWWEDWVSIWKRTNLDPYFMLKWSRTLWSFPTHLPCPPPAFCLWKILAKE